MVYTDITDVTLPPVTITFDVNGNPIIPTGTGYDLNLMGGSPEFHIDILGVLVLHNLRCPNN